MKSIQSCPVLLPPRKNIKNSFAGKNYETCVQMENAVQMTEVTEQSTLFGHGRLNLSHLDRFIIS